MSEAFASLRFHLILKTRGLVIFHFLTFRNQYQSNLSILLTLSQIIKNPKSIIVVKKYGSMDSFAGETDLLLYVDRMI